MDVRQALNDEQYAAVTAPDGPLLVLAAAGTGKTRTLVYRMAYLAARGVAPDRILLLTFTNRAAREMLDRAQSAIHSGVAGLWGGTFHHMANRILRRHGRALGYESDFAILDRDDARTLVGESIRALELNTKEFPRKDVLQALFSRAANTEAAVEDLAVERFGNHAVDPDAVVAVYNRYTRRKRELGSMDFDDLLVNCLRLLTEHASVLDRYREKFMHVLVDEYQDTNTLQAQIVDLLAGGYRNLLVVGDDFQSIYGWRGADFRNIMSFPERYPDARVFKLETNYRSVPEVLEVANACIAGNPEQFQKALRPTREAYQRPRLARLRDGGEQARYVVDLIGELERSGYRRRDIAVLYRAHFHALELQLELTRAGIRHIVTSGVRFFEQRHIKDVCSVVKILMNPGDELAFARLLGLLKGVGPKTIAKLWTEFGGRFNAFDDKQRATLAGALRGEGRRQWMRIEPVLTAYLGDKTGRDGGEIFARFGNAFYDEYANNNFEDYERRMEDIRELSLHAGRYETLDAFLADVALLTNVDAETDVQRSQAEDAVHLSTIHQAKGLEWSVVILIWASEGMLPAPRTVREAEDGEAEERRLFYVTVTRAKDELCICAPEMRRTRDGGVMYMPLSRFVSEIPQHLFRRVRPGF